MSNSNIRNDQGGNNQERPPFIDRAAVRARAAMAAGGAGYGDDAGAAAGAGAGARAEAGPRPRTGPAAAPAARGARREGARPNSSPQPPTVHRSAGDGGARPQGNPRSPSARPRWTPLTREEAVRLTGISLGDGGPAGGGAGPAVQLQPRAQPGSQPRAHGAQPRVQPRAQPRVQPILQPVLQPTLQPAVQPGAGAQPRVPVQDAGTGGLPPDHPEMAGRNADGTARSRSPEEIQELRRQLAERDREIAQLKTESSRAHSQHKYHQLSLTRGCDEEFAKRQEAHDRQLSEMRARHRRQLDAMQAQHKSKLDEMQAAHKLEADKAEAELKQKNECIICLVNQRNMYLTPCGHFVCCKTCWKGICSKARDAKTKTTCPACRAIVTEVFPFYM